jgi:hypothetical protein
LIGSDDFNELQTIVPYEQTFFTSLYAEGKGAQVAQVAPAGADYRRVGFQVLRHPLLWVLRHLFHFPIPSQKNGQLADRSDIRPIIKYGE